MTDTKALVSHDIPELTEENRSERTYVIRNADTKKLEEWDALTGKLIAVEGNRNLTQLDYAPQDRTPYTREIAQHIVQHILEGGSLTSLYKDPAMPSSYTLALWRKTREEFSAGIEWAYEHRAEYHRDQVMELAKSKPTGKDDQTNTTREMEAHKWAASKDFAKRYGSNQGADSTPQAQTIILQVMTGIDRSDPNVQQEIKDVTPSEKSDEEGGDESS